MKMNERQLEGVVDYILEETTLEDFLEEFNITSFEIIKLAYDNGLLDEEILKRMLPTDRI
jgi:hypothetical protein